ncbi:hypothetical protein [Halobacterium litoreum]|uniref:Uncharacterized protein n=1 Tax=Halobacterium litoreum TaxID=2039234 RepID=A0ABD5NB73_9EURY|nr:hypothetical protein [Halobacterium litoreum]UHH14574.1 hypothetical protein LT972_06130 [Halobacterium litoreum]
MDSSNRRFAVAAGVGLLNLAVLLAYGQFVLDLGGPSPRMATLDVAATWAYWLVGLWTMGAVPAALYLRSDAVSPLALTALLTGYCLWDSFSASMESFTPLYYALWPAFLVALAAAGAVERLLRRR